MDIFEEKLLAEWPRTVWNEYRMVLAVSGGADSTALLRAFSRIGNPKYLLTLHVNHQLRGEDSEEDARFTARLADRHGTAFREERIPPEELRAAAVREGSLESGARAIRYRLLLKNAEEWGARYILTAHHADDQLETIVSRLFRGSGIDGLIGMSPFRPLNDAVVLARPFLSFTRREITEYLRRAGETWRTDGSNESPEFLRNRVRRELLPLLNELFPGRVAGSIERLARHAAELKDFLHTELDRKLAAAGLPFPETLPRGVITVPLTVMKTFPEQLRRVWFRRLWTAQNWPMGGMDDSRWRALSELAENGTPAIRELPGKITVQVTGDEMTITPSSEP